VEMNSKQSFDREYDTLKSIGEGTGLGGEVGGVEGGVGRVIDPEDPEEDGDGLGSSEEEGVKSIEPETSACRRVRTRSCPWTVANAETVEAKSSNPVQPIFISCWPGCWCKVKWSVKSVCSLSD
jgi:hypothetical protein